jgi:hypothetical protein
MHMQPASAGDASGGGRAWRRWGPIAAIVAVVAVVAGVLVATSGGDDDDGDAGPSTSAAPASEAPATTSAATEAPATTPAGTSEPETTPASAPSGEITYPLSFSDAAEQGIEVPWDERCDTERGTIAVPDYFAPECYAPFEGDNGGATAPGVTADSIKVVYYLAQEEDPIINYITDAINSDDTIDQEIETMQNVVRYYQAYYETYGRTVELIPFVATGGAADEVAARADAVRIAEEIQPFVVWQGPALTPAFGDELAARGVMCISCVPGQPTQFYQERAPYVWAIDGSQQQKQDHVVEFVRKQLIGKPASHAGEELAATERRFGLLYIETSAASTELAQRFAAEMEAAGAPLAEVIPYALDPATIQQTALQAITRMKTAGVTTVIFTGDPVAPRDFTREATAQAYFPEWVVAAATLVDTNAFGRTYDQQQWAHAFGVTQLAARLSPEISGYPTLYEWFNGEPPPADAEIGVDQPQAALFYSILQNTGPNLTHETWAEALLNANPTARGAISQPSLSWGDKGLWEYVDYHGIDDATLMWWDPELPGQDELRREAPGMWRFVDGGLRYLPGEWTEEDRLFVEDGSVAMYMERPPGEEPGDYPSPAG